MIRRLSEDRLPEFVLTDSGTLQSDLDRKRRTVDTDYFDLSIRELVRMTEEEEIRIAPAFQRQFRWPEETQSALVESLLLGLPVPAIFVATNKDGTWEVVDGLQRICTILRFVGIDAPESSALQFSDNTLRLNELRTLEEFNGLAYADLPRAIRLTFDRRYLRVQVLSDKSDADVRFELFRRLNAGAVALTPQEIRACIFGGSFNTLIEELSELPSYTSILKLQRQNQNNATAAELVLKFFAYIDRAEQFDGKVTRFLNDYMKTRATETNLDVDRALFEESVAFLYEVLDGRPFLRPGVHVTPMNQFEAVLVAFGLILREGGRPGAPPSNWINDPDLVKFSTRGTNTRTMLLGRIRRARELFG